MKLIPATSVIVDERVRLKCQVPLCDSFHKNLMCPPFVISVDEFRRVLKAYKRGLLLQVTARIGEKGNNREEVYTHARRLHEIVNIGEREAFHLGFRFAAGFIGGCCHLCEQCVAVEGSRMCRHPFRARPSMEAVGIDVQATLEAVGLSPSVFPINNYVTWTGLILLD
ncbi:MAG: DUF2284 domain-containing protein [Syntrophales bacterium]|nr:DUF2284 domain-containing protein [Syntrophales bacterium]